MKRLVLVAPIAVLLALGCNGAGDPNAAGKKSSSSTTPASTQPPATTPPATTPPTAPTTSGTTPTAPTTTPTTPTQPAQPGTFDVVFAPNGTKHDVENAVVKALDAAQTSIDIAMYNFTSPQIGDAVERANKRGIAVRVLFDQYQAKLAVSLDLDFKNFGVPFNYVNPTGPVKNLKFHHKFGVIDKQLVIAGSYNWTESADEENYENCLFIREPAIVQAYASEFESIWTTGKGGVSSTNDVIFAPTGTAALMQDKIVTELGKAKTEIVIAMYQFTSSKCAKAVAAAIKRGVKVSILTDNGEASLNKTSLTTCAGAQMKSVTPTGNNALFHDKYCVIDGQTLIVGSFNWNVNQDYYGYENLDVLHDPALCQQYIQNFGQIWNSPEAH